MFDAHDGNDRSPDRPEAGTLRHRYDWDAVCASTAVVELVSIAADVEPSALDPLYDTVDPEALDRLVRRGGGAERDVEVAFAYAGYDVSVSGDGEVTVTERGRGATEE